MAISANYPQPVYVNGYACMNCAQVAEAKKDINPAHPQSGPGGINAQFDPTVTQSPSVIFGGVLASAAAATQSSGQPSTGQPSTGQTSTGQTAPGQTATTPGAATPPRSVTPGLGGLLDISA